MLDPASIGPDARAIVLLSSSLGAPSGSIRPLGPVAWSRLSERLTERGVVGPSELLGMTAGEIESVLDIPGDLAAEYAGLLARSGQLGFEFERLGSRGIWVLTIADDAYPWRLRDRLGTAAPPVLFGSGSVSLLDAGGVAVVGSRDADDEAVAFTQRLAAAIAASGSSLVSGGARGIDVTSMGAAFEAGGTVIGVLPEGIERRLRETTTRAALAGGSAVMLSPYHPSAGFSAGAAMGRNKLVYALSDVAVVVSSADGSGGTWTGALEALKAGWVPVLVRDEAAAPPGNRSLLSFGATALRPESIGDVASATELLELAGASASKVAEPAAPYRQAQLFDDLDA